MNIKTGFLSIYSNNELFLTAHIQEIKQIKKFEYLSKLFNKMSHQNMQKSYKNKKIIRKK